MNERPTGVTIIAALSIIGGVLGIIAGIAVFGLLGSVGFGLGAIIGLVALVVSVLQLIAGIGLWQLKPWGWTLALIMSGVGIALNILNVIQGTPIGSVLVNTLINGVIIYYLMTPDVKRVFGK